MSLASQIAPHLPYLRRYARAVTGAQAAGDAAVASTLEAIIADRSTLNADVAPRLALFRLFQTQFNPEALPALVTAGDDSRFADIAGERLAAITPLSRQALLLSAMEGFTTQDVAWLLDCNADAVLAMIADALDEIDRQTATTVMIIEDEPIIAMDLESIVGELGHAVAGIATTHDEALALFEATSPGLVLADIQLADASSGIDAVRHILMEHDVPVIFITAFPERLLTGERPEPTFLITKPFLTATVKAAIAQAMFFNSTAPPTG
ncbi:MAG: response regulator [Polymorphobacter sp.]